MTQPDLITRTLEEEVKRELRQRGIVVWLDKDGHYTPYVNHLANRYASGEFFAPVVAFRGSYLEMLLALEPYGNGLDQETLLIHMPGHTEDSIRKTPILELYRAGYRYRRALDTLIRETATGLVSPTDLEAYLNNGVIDLEAAELWLQQSIAQPKDGLAALLASRSLESVLDGVLNLEGLIAEASKLKSLVQDDTSLSILTQHLNYHTGLDHPFTQFFLGRTAQSFQDIGDTFVAWLMCVEYVNDLDRLPYLDELNPLKQLSPPLRKTCGQLIHHLRDRYPKTYAAIASTVETRLEQELNAIRPEDLGKIDTFQREEIAVLEAAVLALLAADWAKALAWAQSRTTTTSFWIEQDKTRRLEWLLIQAGATLGNAVQQADRSLKDCHTLRDALEQYTQSGYEVDRAHRRFEQQQLKLLEPTLPHYVTLQNAADQLRVQYRSWADQLAQDFATLCNAEGFLPEADLQQRTLYDQVVHPLTQTPRKVAFFLIDAFRYEMATELLSEFAGEGTTVLLKGRYAELPSITAVGMNALAPVSKAGRLLLAGSDGFKGFKTGEYTVRSPSERFRAMSEKSIDTLRSGRKRAREIKLAEVCSRTAESLKKGGLAEAELIIVHSKEIDDAGEANVGLATFETWLRQIKSAWSHLRNMGVNEFIFTADHGFLLQDKTTQTKSYGSKRDPNRRHVLMSEPRSQEGCVTVSLNALQYDGQAGYLLFRKDTATFTTGTPNATFVHGGNSLQERIIPVLTVSHRHTSETVKLKYLIEVKAEKELLGFSRLQLQVKPAPDVQLTFIGARTVSLALRALNRSDIQLTVKDAPSIELKNQVLQVPVEGGWVEVLFDLKGQQGDRVNIEVYHPEALEDIDPAVTTEYFNVMGTLQASSSAPLVESAPSSTPIMEWHERFEDTGVRQVFLHLQQHGSITETELTQMLGSARLVRRFSMEFEEHLQKVPFPVKIETTANGKRYVRQN